MQTDRDKNGRLDSKEIHEALKAGGFTISDQSSLALYRKYNTTGYGLDMAQWIAMVIAVLLHLLLVLGVLPPLNA